MPKMKKCLICRGPTAESNGLCPECGKRWIDSINSKPIVDIATLSLADDADKIIQTYESESAELRPVVMTFVDKVNVLQGLNSIQKYVASKSTLTHQFLVKVLQGVLEHYPFPRVMLIRLADYPEISRDVQASSPVLQQLIAEYVDDLKKELQKAMSKKQSAGKLKRKQKQLRIELILLTVLTVFALLSALYFYISESAPSSYLIVLAVVPVMFLFIMKVTRYANLDMNMRTNPHLSYQIDLMDIPETYIENLRTQLSRFGELDHST